MALRWFLFMLAIAVCQAGVSYELYSSYQCQLSTLANKTTGAIPNGCHSIVIKDCLFYVLVSCPNGAPTIMNCTSSDCTSCGLTFVSSTGTCGAVCGGGEGAFGMKVMGCVDDSPAQSPSSAMSGPSVSLVTLPFCLVMGAIWLLLH